MYVGKHEVGITKKNGREYIQIRIAWLLVVRLLPDKRLEVMVSVGMTVFAVYVLLCARVNFYA